MHENNGHEIACGAASFAIGAAVGAGLMLLLAPRPGRETREDLIRKIDEWRDKTRDVLDQTLDMIRGKVKEQTEE